jgi:hypothetical protein
MRKISLVASAVVLATVAAGCSAADPNEPVGTSQDAIEAYNPLPRHMSTQDRFVHEQAHGGGGGSNLSYHGGGTITAAHVVAIFWGPSWGSGGADNGTATTLEGFISNYGTTGEYNVITQYYSGSPATYIQKSALGTASYFDGSTPPTNVTDADVQAEVSSYIARNGFDSSAIYEVFLPSTSYSSNGTSDSCGGPSLAYCAYHGNFAASVGDVKYASMPYPSCGGCQSTGFTTAQNFEHFISHETREAVTDEDGSAWYDRRGYEADDKCAWSPAPFIDSSTGYAYQYEWSNKVSGCVQTM